MIHNLDHIRDEIVRHAMGPNPRAAILNQWLDEFEAAVRSERAPLVVTDLDRVDLTAAASRTGEARENATGRSVAGSTCWDCGASVTETKHGRATLHRAGCQHPGERGPQ